MSNADKLRELKQRIDRLEEDQERTKREILLDVQLSQDREEEKRISERLSTVDGSVFVEVLRLIFFVVPETVAAFAWNIISHLRRAIHAAFEWVKWVVFFWVVIIVIAPVFRYGLQCGGCNNLTSLVRSDGFDGQFISATFWFNMAIGVLSLPIEIVLKILCALRHVPFLHFIPCINMMHLQMINTDTFLFGIIPSVAYSPHTCRNYRDFNYWLESSVCLLPVLRHGFCDRNTVDNYTCFVLHMYHSVWVLLALIAFDIIRRTLAPLGHGIVRIFHVAALRRHDLAYLADVRRNEAALFALGADKDLAAVFNHPEHRETEIAMLLRHTPGQRNPP